MDQKRPILISGIHRSGTTWVGNTLAQNDDIGLIYEPFHQEHPPGICAAHFWGPYHYINASNAGRFRPALSDTLAFRYAWRAQLKRLPPQDPRRTLRDALRFARYRRQQRRPLVKDPLALLSAAWLADTFDMKVVVLIRHPAAFVGSVKRMGWSSRFPFDVFYQKRLVADEVHPYVDLARAYQAQRPDWLDQSILVWRILYYIVARYQEQHPEWLFVRHEDLSRKPLATFEAMCRYLDLPFTRPIRDFITHTSSAENPADVTGREIHQLERNSRANIFSWRNRLEPAEIERVRSGTADVWPAFYADDDWHPPDAG